jgi:hypothetical protein
LQGYHVSTHLLIIVDLSGATALLSSLGWDLLPEPDDVVEAGFPLISLEHQM